MVVKLVVSKLGLTMVQNIATQTDDAKVLEQLARIDSINIVCNVICNPATTKDTRGIIYELWKDRKDKKELYKL